MSTLTNIRVKLVKLIPFRYRMVMKRFLKRKGFPKLNRIPKASETASQSKKVLFATSFGAHRSGNLLESIMSEHLINRGHQADHILCNGMLQFCNVAEFSNTNLEQFEKGGSPACRLCNNCIQNGTSYWKSGKSRELYIDKSEYAMNFQQNYNTLQSEENTFQELVHKTYCDIPIGEHAKSSTLRYFCQGELSEKEHKTIFLKFLAAGITFVNWFEPIAKKYDRIVCFHGIYTPHGLIGDVCRKNDIHLVNWNTSYRKSRFIFTVGDTYHRTLISEKEALWLNKNWTEEKEKLIVDYIISREKGTGDWQQFNDNPSLNVERFDQLDWNKTFLLLPNVVWDAQLYFPDNYFGSMIEWVLFTIKIFERQPDLNLIIRIHPAEIKRFSPTRQPLYEEIEQAFPELPPNIHIIKNNDKISTHRLAERARSIIIYGSKAGIEFSTLGKRVIACGESWIKNKGFAIEPKSKEEYEALFDDIESNFTTMDEKELCLARQFAYHFFFSRAIKIEEIIPDKNNLGLIPNDQLLYSGKVSQGLDFVLNAIINKSEFILDEN